jgi:hypothetical protein
MQDQPKSCIQAGAGKVMFSSSGKGATSFSFCASCFVIPSIDLINLRKNFAFWKSKEVDRSCIHYFAESNGPFPPISDNDILQPCRAQTGTSSTACTSPTNRPSIILCSRTTQYRQVCQRCKSLLQGPKPTCKWLFFPRPILILLKMLLLAV